MVADEIKSFKELLDAGVISQEEFDVKKAELLSRSRDSAPVAYEKSRIAAGLFALFLGALGIHKFYLGYTQQGVIMLLVSLVGALIIVGPIVMAIVAFIEGIIYLMKSDSGFDRIYVKGSKEWF